MKTTIIVDKNHPIKESYYKTTSFKDIKTINNKQLLVETNTYDSFIKMQELLKTKGIDINITNGYEFPHKGDFTDEIDTGLVLEIESTKDINQYLNEFGFINRDNNRIRYVGPFIAKKLNENNLTLEEYLDDYSEIVVVKKEPNMTSFMVVNEISNLFGIKRVGHTGTLDPMAEGVLIVAVGKATKIVELLTATEKEYIASAKLGIRTDTRDTDGKIIEEKEVPDKLPIKEVVESYKKTYMQEVPLYSAVKIDGKKLYDYAREEKKVDLPKREVHIKEIELIDHTKDTFTIRTLVSKGTYIRSLIDDIGKDLGVGATMTSLVRTKQGTVTLDKAATLSEIKEGNYTPYKVEDVLNYEKVEIEDNETLTYIKNGRRLNNKWNIKDKVMLFNNGKLLGIYEVDGKELKTWKNF